MSPALRSLRRRRRESNARGATTANRRWFAAFGGGFLAAVLVTGVLSAGAVGLFVVSTYNSFVATVAPPEEVLATLPRGGARIYDRNGTLLYEFVDQVNGLRRPVSIGDISPWLIDATVSTEDASFWENNGLNVRGLARAAWENFSPFGGDPFEGSGGSSITQQLAKNVYIPFAERSQRTPERKLKEAAIALELTQRYPKDQLLEWYLNSIPYGGVYVGVEAAAQGYFGIPASDLTLAQASLLAGIPQQPVRYDPLQNPDLAKARQSEVLDLMVRHGRVTAEQAELARNEPLVIQQARFDIEAPHFVLGRVAREIEERFGADALYRDGLEVTTTLDLELQGMATGILEGWIREFETQSGGHNGAFYALDPQTGQILVYLGSRDYFNDDIKGRNDNITAINSPGSTLKPFTFMTAFQKGWSTGTGVLDVPTKIADPSTGEDFTPRNPIGGYQGVIAADKALGNSLNVTAIRAILYAGVQPTLTTLKAMGFTTLDNEGGYGPALTLGGADITLEDLTYAYSVLAGQGMMRGQEALEAHGPGERALDPVALLKVANAEGKTLYEWNQPLERRVVGANYAYLVTSILSDPNAHCITFGACGALSLPGGRPGAVKTGTSEPVEGSTTSIGETWAVGYTPHLVAGVWFGNSDNTLISNIVSTSVSWRSWRDFMTQASTARAIPLTRFERPAGVVERELCYPSGKLPTDACPKERRYTGLFAAEVLGQATDRPPTELMDDWWQKQRIDVRTGLVATNDTPREFITEEVRLVFPKEEAGALTEWARKVGLNPSSVTDPTVSLAFARITSPSQGARVSGQVSINGVANGPDFKRYDLEVGQGTNPSNWQRFYGQERATSGGELAKWNATSVKDGVYTIRLLVEDEKLGQLRYQITVTVANGNSGGGGPEATPTVPPNMPPVAQISSPSQGSTVKGTVSINGTAASGAFQRATIEYGKGPQPGSWETIDTLDSPELSGTLASWNTSRLDDGPYTLRVTVVDRQRGTATTAIIVNVQN